MMRALLLLLLSIPCYADFDGQVVGVSDGDTIIVLVGHKQVKVRLSDIDAPEKRQAWGRRAKEALSAMVYGRAVHVTESGKDRYGRTLGRVYVGRTDVNAAMVAGGHAWVYRRYSKDRELLSIEDDARAAKRGLWGIPNPIPPWEWRKKKSPHKRARDVGVLG